MSASRRLACRSLLTVLAAGSLALASGACSSSGGTAATSTSSSGASGGTSAPPTTAAPGATTAPAAPGTSTGTTPAVDPASVPVRPSRGCQAGGGQPLETGTHVDISLTANGLERSYKRYLPASGIGTTGAPLVIDLHGYSEGNAVHTAMSSLAATAEVEHFVLVSPLGTGTIPFWNAVPKADGPDDIAFLSDVIDDVAGTVCVDLNRVYVAGLSNGAFMSSLVACRLADKVAAVAPVAGLMYPADCDPARPMPIVAFHGTADQFVTYDGSTGAAVATLPFNDETQHMFDGIEFRAVPDTLGRWAAAEGCDTPPTEEPVSASVTLIRYAGCEGGSVVELYRVDGGGHAWPGSAFSQSIEKVVGPTTMEIDANALMWAFFAQHPLPAA